MTLPIAAALTRQLAKGDKAYQSVGCRGRNRTGGTV
jgi:hypothetical protein